ncbi:hypothetical protein JJB09_26130 [Rhizobium sp. KVB221]|uniref:DUF6894 domain-containing protein n=1 Tax=Rhizobium setariae TaxID=2801340 RepID=A0A936YRL8_9HYPH|nr:hypothetical protein [Rhizobium setariae]MBL0375490.1 hypothetical protein [Rhizobium setariae]
MPVYFFNMRDGKHVTRDPAGVELENDNEARMAGLAAARRYLADGLLLDNALYGKAFEVSDCHGTTVVTISFIEARQSDCWTVAELSSLPVRSGYRNVSETLWTVVPSIHRGKV